MPPAPQPGPGIEQQSEPFPETQPIDEPHARHPSPHPPRRPSRGHRRRPSDHGADLAAGLRPLCAAAGLVLALDEVGFDVWLTPVPDDAEVAFWHGAPVPDGVRPWLRASYALTVGHRTGSVWRHRPRRTVVLPYDEPGVRRRRPAPRRGASCWPACSASRRSAAGRGRGVHPAAVLFMMSSLMMSSFIHSEPDTGLPCRPVRSAIHWIDQGAPGDAAKTTASIRPTTCAPVCRSFISTGKCLSYKNPDQNRSIKIYHLSIDIMIYQNKNSRSYLIKE